ncbi:MAG: glycoside hydrolase [Erythrobacter sp.]|nr:glycoside hydrolase [Erythrobacter sp.]
MSSRGIPILSSGKVPDEALIAARNMARDMFAHRPDLAEWLAANDYRIAIIAEDEALLDLPDKASWSKPALDDPRLTRCELKHYDVRIGAKTDREYWNQRARAIGGKRMADGAEDVLGLPSSRYYGETIFVHELGHLVPDAIQATDPALYAEVEAAYANALANDLWLDEYTTTTIQEYWAEGTQFWFNSNRIQSFDGRRILNHTDLQAYDPMLFAALAKAYGDNHQLKSDPFWMSAARVPPGPLPENTAEVC